MWVRLPQLPTAQTSSISPIGSFPQKNQLFVVQAAGGGSVQLNSPLLPTNGNVTSLAVTPDGLSVVYLADQQLEDVLELYWTSFSSPGSSTKQNSLLVAGEDVANFTVR